MPRPGGQGKIARMKAAYLIMAHHQPSHLARLIRRLDCDWAFFFIHVDRKSDIRPFQTAIPDRENVVFLTGGRRVKTYWGGYSMVRVTLNLMREASGHEESFDRYCLLTGGDFPIKSQQLIQEQFSTDKEFLRVDRHLRRSDKKLHRSFVSKYYFLDLPIPRRLNLGSISGTLPRKPYDKIDLYHGSAWWALTDGCVRSIFGFLRENRDYAPFHWFSFHPHEIFFHSIIKQTPYQDCIVHDYSDGPVPGGFHEHGCHYVHWPEGSSPSPRTLDRSDLEALLVSEALFARKFDETTSADLLDALEANIGTA